MPIVSGVQAKK